jgi:predicted amidophosphoribosyltransferase
MTMATTTSGPCWGLCGRQTRAKGKLCPKCAAKEQRAVARLPRDQQGPQILRDLFRFPPPGLPWR